jgi:hypothetical protein
MGLGSEIRDPEKTYSGSRIQWSKRHRIPDPGSATLILALMDSDSIRIRIQEFLYMEKDEQCSGACRKELAGIEALEKSKDQEDKAKLNKLFT